MRLIRCLLMIIATLSMASYPAAARPDHRAVAVHTHHEAAAAPGAHDHRVAHAAHPCSGHHHPSDHDRGCCGKACCGPSCFSPTMASDGALERVSRPVVAPRPRPDTALRGTRFDPLDRPPIAG